MKNEFYNKYLRPIALSVAFSVIGQIFVMLLTKLVGVELSKVVKSVILFVVTSSAVLFFFPKILGIPFGKISLKEWLRRVGFYVPDGLAKHILLGILLGCISLTGMLLGSFYTGKYDPDISNITLGQAIFSLTPAIWEEILFRGVIMILLIQYTGNLKKAFWWQILIFSLCHLKGFALIDLVEIISVAIIGFTFSLVAVKSKALVAGIIYHFMHDAFLYFVQLPGGVYHGFVDNITFYSFLWSAMAINILIIVISADRLQIRGQLSIYNAIDASDFNFFKIKSKQTSPRMERIQRVLFLLAAFACFTSLMERFSSPFSLVFIFLLIAVILNILAYIFYKKLGKHMVVLAFFINGICNLFSGYDSFLRGSQRAYIITVLIGIVYILLGLFVWIMMKQPRDKQE